MSVLGILLVQLNNTKMIRLNVIYSPPPIHKERNIIKDVQLICKQNILGYFLSSWFCHNFII